MRTILILVAGFLLLVGSLAAAHFFFKGQPSATMWTTLAYISTWLVITVVNLLVGVFKAGYSFRGEFPIFLLLFALPAAAAIVAWKTL